MAKLLGSFNWSSSSIVKTDDFSGNGITSASMTAITIGSGVVGNTAIFDGATSTIKFGNVFNFAAGQPVLSCLIQLKRTASKAQMLVFKFEQFWVQLNADNTVTFSVFIGADQTHTSTGTITINVSQTIECVYDGVNLIIYINGAFDSQVAQVGTVTSSVNDFLIGHADQPGDSLFYAGEFEAIDIRDDAPDADQVDAWHDNPLGTEYEFQSEHKFELGDIVGGGRMFEPQATSPPLPEVIGVISFVDDDFILRVKAVLSQFNLNEVPVRRGNILDEDRQWTSEFSIVNGLPIIQIKDRITTVLGSVPTSEASKGFKFTKDSCIFKGRIVPDFLNEPAPAVGQIDDFAPTDIEFTNCLFISSTTPVSWTGLQAPPTTKAQLIFLSNIGSFNITIRNNHAGSLAANRFLVNTNVILSPNDSGFIFYDVVRSRWRVNKI